MLVGFTLEAFTEASSQTLSYLLLNGPREYLQQRTKSTRFEHGEADFGESEILPKLCEQG